MQEQSDIRAKEQKEYYDLYYFASCPFCIKVRIQLALLGVHLPLKNIKTSPDKKEALIEGGGKKQVPCLRIQKANDDVQWLYESTDIVRYFKQGLN